MPTNLQQFLEFSRGVEDTPKSKMIFLLACICWSLWLTRNEYVFQNKVITSPNVVVHRSIIFLQKWSLLLKEKEKGWASKTAERLSRHLAQNVQE